MESWKDCKPGLVWLWDEGEGSFEPVAFRTMVVSLCSDRWRYYPLSFFLILLRLALPLREFKLSHKQPGHLYARVSDF